MQDNLTVKQQDYAVFLPAISGFYATFIGKQRVGTYVDPARMPAALKDMEQFNWLNSSRSEFPYRWSLYSGGHANLDVKKTDASEDMVRNREAGSFILGDSGGFQIAKGLWEGEWRDPNGAEVQQRLADLAAQGTHTVTNARGKTVTVDPLADYKKLIAAAQNKRAAVLEWLDTISDYGMILDIPTWVIHDAKASAACGITTIEEAIAATKYNNLYFMQHRRGRETGTKFLNVLQGDNHTSAESWYEEMKEFCDPKKYPGTHFDGWAMGGQNVADVHLVLKRLVALKFDNLLQPGIHDWMHFLGISKLEWAVLLTAIQRAVRKHINPNFTISFDCASPFLATANGQMYYQIDLPHDGKWSYKMRPGADDHKYATDIRLFRDALLQDRDLGFQHFEDSPVSRHLMIKDICVYADGDLNKVGKVSKTSWDSFSYMLMMAHNVWMHIESVQRANREFDAGFRPSMLWHANGDHAKFEDIVEAVFTAKDKKTALEIIDYYDSYWMDIPGSRGFKGKKSKNSKTMFDTLFEVVDDADDLDEDQAEDLMNQHMKE